MLDIHGETAEYQLDPEETGLEGCILAREPEHAYWTLHIEWKNPDDDEPATDTAWIEIHRLPIDVANWRNLEGQEVQVQFDPAEEDSILPGSSPCFTIAIIKSPTTTAFALASAAGASSRWSRTVE